MKRAQAQAMIGELRRCGGLATDDELESDLLKLSDHLQTLLPQMSDEWAVVQGEGPDGSALRPAILALDQGFVWQVGIERQTPGEAARWQITVALYQPSEFGLLIEHEALAEPNPDRGQRLWRALAREKLTPACFTAN